MKWRGLGVFIEMRRVLGAGVSHIQMNAFYAKLGTYLNLSMIKGVCLVIEGRSPWER